MHTRCESRKKEILINILGYLLEVIIKSWRFGFFSFEKNLATFGHFFHEKSRQKKHC
jgi:hypothetical protein